MLIGSKIIHFSEIDSTMDYCKKIAIAGEPEGTIVSTEFQNSGRGRFNRIWISPYGVNIQISILLKPKPQHLIYINMAAALAICETAEIITNVKASIKWPNDVQVNGKKLAGILIESSIKGDQVDYLILGMGINVNLDVMNHPDISQIATSLKEINNKNVDKNHVMEILWEKLGYYYLKIKNGESLTSIWASRINTIGRDVTISFPGTNKEPISGTAKNILPDGSIQIILDDGTVFNALAGEISIENYS